ncbi:MAG: hypothetical protein ACLS3C_11250 [Oscillospiraceae bacterium]
MDYITYKRYKGSGIGGYFNLRHGTKVTENGGFLHAPDGRGICAVTSEDGWEHFRPDTPEGAYRQKLLDKLYRFYISGKGDAAADFTDERFPDADNYYWKTLAHNAHAEADGVLFCAARTAAENGGITYVSDQTERQRHRLFG